VIDFGHFPQAPSMNLIERISRQFEDSAHAKLAAIEWLAAPVAEAVEAMTGCLLGNGKILACGNGGSAADAQHFAAELVNRFEMDRPPLAAVALTTDSSILTSIGNDYAFAQVFSKQIYALGQPGDVLLAISTSGNSPSVLAAITAAHEREMRVVALTGKGGGKITDLLTKNDIHVCARYDQSAHRHECHFVSKALQSYRRPCP
jgi:D-sedoheptulose 7-phosphate isomerase